MKSMRTLRWILLILVCFAVQSASAQSPRKYKIGPDGNPVVPHPVTKPFMMTAKKHETLLAIAPNTGSMPIIAYIPTWWRGSIAVGEYPYDKLGIIIVFPAQAASASAPYFNASDLAMSGELDQMVSLAHAKGCKVVISCVGGYGTQGMPGVVSDSVKCQTFVNAAVAFMTAHNCDGIEADWEFPRSSDAVGWKRFIIMMHDALAPLGKLLMTSGYYSDLGRPYVIEDMNQFVSVHMPMTYTMWMGSGASPYYKGFDTPVDLPTTGTGGTFAAYKGYSLSNPQNGGILTYLANGYTPLHLAVSAGEGTRFTGGSGTMGVPYTGWQFTSTVSSSRGSGYPAIPASGQLYEAKAQAAYAFSGTTSYSFYTEQSLAAIATYGKQIGCGYFMIYDLPVYCDGTGPNKWHLIDALYAVTSGGAPPPAEAPSGTFSASPSSLPFGGGQATLAWTSQNASELTITPGVGSVAAFGSMNVSVSSTTTYLLLLSGPGGSLTKSFIVTVAGPPSPPVTNPCDTSYARGRSDGNKDSTATAELWFHVGFRIGDSSHVCPPTIVVHDTTLVPAVVDSPKVASEWFRKMAERAR